MAGMAHGDPGALAAASLQRLRALDVPEDEIARLRKTGKAAAAHRRARAGGWRRDREAGAGRHAHRGGPAALQNRGSLAMSGSSPRCRSRISASFAPGQSAEAQFVAFPGRSFDGTVEFIYPALSPETRTARVRIVIPNPDQALRAAMYASVEIAAPAADRAGARGAVLRRHR